MKQALRATLVLLAGLAAPAAAAQGLDAFEGRWRGEGQLSLAGEPAQRLRCQLRFRAASAPDSAVFSGRCATAQAAQSFVYLLRLLSDGTIEARNTTDPPDDLPALMRGTAQDGILRFEARDEALFALRLADDGLHFTIEADTHEGPASGSALLQQVGGQGA
ncbi:MAG: hypothetical protein ACXIVG_04710 [Pararhodobacter sp.]